MKIAIASGKGGTGKTTVATSLAYVAASDGHTVAYLDGDVEEPNGQASWPQPPFRMLPTEFAGYWRPFSQEHLYERTGGHQRQGGHGQDLGRRVVCLSRGESGSSSRLRRRSVFTSVLRRPSAASCNWPARIRNPTHEYRTGSLSGSAGTICSRLAAGNRWPGKWAFRFWGAFPSTPRSSRAVTAAYPTSTVLPIARLPGRLPR